MEIMDLENVEDYISKFKCQEDSWVGIMPIYGQSPFFIAAIYGNKQTFSLMNEYSITANKISWLPDNAYSEIDYHEEIVKAEHKKKIEAENKTQNFHILHILALFGHNDFLKSIVTPYYTILYSDGIVQPYWYDIVFGLNTVSPLENDRLLAVETKESFFLSWMHKEYPGRNMDLYPVSREEFKGAHYQKQFQKYLAQPDLYGWNALHWSAACGKKDLLIEALDSDKGGVNIDTRTKGGFTALLLACIAGSDTCVDILLQAGASLIPTEENITPLHAAAAHNKLECLMLLLTFITANDLELDINYQDNNLRTALHYACVANSPECVKLLLDYRSDIHITDLENKTALERAQEKNNTACARLIIEHEQKPKAETTPNARI